MAAVPWLALAATLLTSAISLLPAARPWVRLAPILASAVVLGCGVALVLAGARGDGPTGTGGLLRADALSSYMLLVVGAVGLTATWGGLSSAGTESSDSVYAALVSLFLGAMSLAVLADNLGVMWVAVEATTIATTFLVGHHRTRHSLEAAWKYVVLGSVGVAIAFLGIVLLYAATRQSGVPTLSWSVLVVTHPALSHALVRVACALAALGFATKAGLAPMHSWLPDAHSQAPAPVSGLMSGVLLAVAFYAIMRVQAVAAAVIGPGLMRGLLVAGGLLSLLVAALLLVRQRDYKRMLAYSSIEHMGLMALGAAAGGPLGMTAVLLHMLGHGLTKAGLFVVAGRILSTEGSTRIADIHGLLTRRPGLGVPFVAGMTALLGFPPFSLFFSELGIVLAAWDRGLGWAAAAAVVLLVVVFAALSRLTFSLVLGGVPVGEAAVVDRSWHGPRVPLVLALAVTGVAGFAGSPLGGVLARAAEALRTVG